MVLVTTANSIMLCSHRRILMPWRLEGISLMTSGWLRFSATIVTRWAILHGTVQTGNDLAQTRNALQLAFFNVRIKLLLVPNRKIGTSLLGRALAAGNSGRRSRTYTTPSWLTLATVQRRSLNTLPPPRVSTIQQLTKATPWTMNLIRALKMNSQSMQLVRCGVQPTRKKGRR